LRFLNLHLKSPDTENLNIEFTEGLNIISITDSGLFDFFKKIPFLSLYGSYPDEITSSSDNILYAINLSVSTSESEVCFINDKGIFSVRENNGSGDNPSDNMGNVKNIELNDNFTVQDFILSCFFDTELIEKKNDPVFEKETIKSFFLKNETVKYGSSFFSGVGIFLKEKEKELTGLNREKQLLELKKMKREKLLREIQLSEKELKKLESKRESILKYKSLLNELKQKTEDKNRLSVRINNLKKNLVELREFQEKSDAMVKKLSERFPYFFDKGFDQLPDLGKIQESFNKYRDLNEQIDIFFVKKKRFTEIFIKIIQASAIFSLISALVILFKPVIFPVLAIISGFSAAMALLLFTVYYFKIREFRPVRLFEQKKQMEDDLIEILKKNNFKVEDCRTGEIYELLFQYFNDFISYRDINSEVVELKKKIPDSLTCNGKEKKLDNLIHSFEEAEQQVQTILENLDESIHIRPEPDDLTEIFIDIDDLLEDNGKEIVQKKDLIVKFEAEITEYDKIENSFLSVENELKSIINKIEECRNFIDHINFLIKVLNETTEKWTLQKIQSLSDISVQKFIKITGGVLSENEVSDKFNTILCKQGIINNEQTGFLQSFSLSVKAALSEMLRDSDLPPFFVVGTCLDENDFAGNLKNLLLELFPGRQVILIVPGNDVNFEGNLITI